MKSRSWKSLRKTSTTFSDLLEAALVTHHRQTVWELPMELVHSAPPCRQDRQLEARLQARSKGRPPSEWLVKSSSCCS